MLQKILPLLLFLNVLTINAQEPFYKSYSWEKKPNYKSFKIDPSEDIIAFKDKVVNEFYFLDKSLTEFQLVHKILWLNSNDKIEDYNKIYLPYNSGAELLENKARVITPKGKVLELDESKILTSTNEETNRSYKYFALEGIEIGSFIEYYYVVRKYPTYKGKRVTLQSSFKKHNISFDLYAPKNLLFAFKSYNGLSDVKNDTLLKEKQHWSLNVEKIEKLENEEHSSYEAEKKYLVYNLDKNTANKASGISSYKTRSKGFYKYLYVNLDKNEIKLLEDLIEKISLKENSNDLSKIRAIENYIKSNFFISDVQSENLETVGEIIKSNTANENGMMKLYISILKHVNIPFEVVLTSDRFETKFDQKFESGNFLTDYLLYFPSIKEFTSIKELGSRVGFPPYELTDNFGLFIKEVAIGDFKNAIGKIKYIKPPSEDVTIDSLDIKVTFNSEDFTQNKINIIRSFSGYYAGYIQPYANMINKESEEELYNSIIKSINENLEIIDKKASNNKVELFGVKPFVIETNTLSEGFTNKAGRKYLFKVGELIGTQIEMYQEKTRKLPVEDDYQRSFIRKLEIVIPDGFHITNLEDINIDHSFEKSGKKLLKFHSYYKINKNILTIYADEYYKLNRIELNDFEPYRTVVNAAADFNKIVLIMEPLNSNP